MREDECDLNQKIFGIAKENSLFQIEKSFSFMKRCEIHETS